MKKTQPKEKKKMSYRSIMAMASSQSLTTRIAACAAEQGNASPIQWAQAAIWKVCATPGWDDKWDYAIDTANENVNPDTGMRSDVISDEDILAAVQPLVAPPEPPAEPPA